MKTSEPVPILLFSVSEYLPLYVARALPARKYTIYCLGPAGQTFQFSRFCKKYFTCAGTDDALVTQINTISRKYGFAAVIPLDTSATVCTARIRRRLTCAVFPLSPIGDIMVFVNKWYTALLLVSSGIRHPKTILVQSPQKLFEGLLRTPFLIKPLMQGGGRGIQKISGSQDIKDYKKSFSPYKTFPLIVQEYIDGTDVDLSIVAKDGIIYGWTIQRWKRGGELEFLDDPQILSIGQKLVRRVRFSGFMHIDMRRQTHTGNLYVLDCNPRCWGSIGASIGAGVDFIGLAVHLTQNKRTPRVRQRLTTYLAPILLLKTAFKNPRFIRQASYASWHDFIGMFSDPLPYVILFVKLCIERVVLTFTFTAGIRKWLVDMEQRAYLSHITR